MQYHDDQEAAQRALNEHFSASQLRLDTWNSLKHLTALLAERNAAGATYERLLHKVRTALERLEPIEMYWAFPSEERFRSLARLLDRAEYESLARAVGFIVRALTSASYRRRIRSAHDIDADKDAVSTDLEAWAVDSEIKRPYFEVLIVDRISDDGRHLLREGLRDKQQADDAFVYDTLVVPSYEDALIAISLNAHVQAVVIGPDFSLRSNYSGELLHHVREQINPAELDGTMPAERVAQLASVIGDQRPEVDVYLVSDASVEEIAGQSPRNVRRVFYQLEDSIELHLNIIRGVQERYNTPFFSALKAYSKQPTGVFHAMPISRGKSIQRSNWIQDMGDFYGTNIFLAETSSTSGGLDSLLDPRGPIKKAQELAARAFHAEHTYFATNGTSTCNKIVVQALVKPGDIVLVDRDCHKSHHYGMVLAGAEVVYLDSYSLDEYSMYGAVPLRAIKRALLDLRDVGKLDRVRMLLLTNCTFDGFVYNVERVMEECLAIKPDLVFLWDEAWFGFAGFTPTYRQRTAMWVAAKLRRRYASREYRTTFAAWKEKCGSLSTDEALEHRLLADPDAVRVRVYACQSTHKTLTALRQGSMIHIHDEDFGAKNREAFHEAYMTHTSTSPNYQILASLDIGRRQVELEGYELVQKQVEMAMVLRERIATHPLVSKWFKVLTVKHLIPESYRQSGIERYFDTSAGWSNFGESWARDEFVLDPTRITLFVGQAGVDGDSFKNQYLMDKHGIQINKTSRNTVLFMTNIGTTRSSVAYLLEVLVDIAEELDRRQAVMSRPERRVFEGKVRSLTEDAPPLPHFSEFHPSFRPVGCETREGDLRKAFFLAYEETACEFMSLEEVEGAIAAGRNVVAAIFIIPYPPGFPILVPGQIVSQSIVEFMRKLDVKEIHGYEPELGLRVFTDESLAAASPPQNLYEGS